MKKYFLHPGFPKTGTSYLQHEIFNRYQNIRYLSRPFTQYNHGLNQLQYANGCHYKKEYAKHTLDWFPENKIVISDETLCGRDSTFSFINGTSNAKRFSDILGPDATVILFVRGQKDMMASIYNQYVKGYLHGDLPIDQFIWSPKLNFKPQDLDNIGNGDESTSLDHLYYNTNKPLIQRDSFLYLEVIDMYKSLFYNVEVFLYEDLKNSREEVLDRLDKIIGEKRINSEKSKDKIVNASLQVDKLYEKTILNRYRNITTRIPYTHRMLKMLISLRKKEKSAYLENYTRFLATAPNYYVENNVALSEKYPEIGIQRYPDAYWLTKR